jgi:hypothetical protein
MQACMIALRLGVFRPVVEGTLRRPPAASWLLPVLAPASLAGGNAWHGAGGELGRLLLLHNAGAEHSRSQAGRGWKVRGESV